MMILSNLSSGTPTPIETSRWLPSAEYEDPPSWTVDTWANKIVYLLGAVHNLGCRIRRCVNKSLTASLQDEWQYFSVTIRDHEAACPMACRPLSVVPERAFEAVGYTNGSVAAAWQMYHTLALVHAVCIPSMPAESAAALHSLPPIATSLAQKIVANSSTNRNSTAWVNAVQLLTIAGQYLVEHHVRDACKKALEDIQRATGWNTKDSIAILS